MLFNFSVMNINVKAMLFVSQVSFDNYVPEGVLQKVSSRSFPQKALFRNSREKTCVKVSC